MTFFQVIISEPAPPVSEPPAAMHDALHLIGAMALYFLVGVALVGGVILMVKKLKKHAAIGTKS